MNDAGVRNVPVAPLAAGGPAGPAHPPPEPMRIEMVVPSLPAAGMEVMVVNLARALRERGHSVGVTCIEAEGELASELRRDGHVVSLVRTPGLLTNAHAPALVAHFRRVRPHVVHVHSGAWTKAARAARAAGVRGVVHTVHGLLDREPWYGPLFKRWAAASTDSVVSVSVPLADYLRTVVGIDARKLHVVLNGVDTTRFAPGPRSGVLRSALGLGERPLVGIVARLAPVKNHLLLLDAFARVRASVPDAALVLVGHGELREAIDARIAELGLGGSVRLAGLLRDVERVYLELDAFVLCSLAEGTSLSLLEAMASGVPAVATDVGGNAHLLDGGRCGWLVPSGDADALARGLVQALTDDAGRRARTEAARARVCDRYSHEAMLQSYETLYAALRQR